MTSPQSCRLGAGCPWQRHPNPGEASRTLGSVTAARVRALSCQEPAPRKGRPRRSWSPPFRVLGFLASMPRRGWGGPPCYQETQPIISSLSQSIYRLHSVPSQFSAVPRMQSRPLTSIQPTTPPPYTSHLWGWTVDFPLPSPQ